MKNLFLIFSVHLFISLIIVIIQQVAHLEILLHYQVFQSPTLSVVEKLSREQTEKDWNKTYNEQKNHP